MNAGVSFQSHGESLFKGLRYSVNNVLLRAT
jgi:hypothetical protein